MKILVPCSILEQTYACRQLTLERAFIAKTDQKSVKKVRRPGIEPGSIAWKATMLTFTPPTLLLVEEKRKTNRKVCYLRSNHRHGVTQQQRQYRRTRYIAFSDINVCFPVRLADEYSYKDPRSAFIGWAEPLKLVKFRKLCWS